MVFIVGCPRSGTTVFGQILAQYPDFMYLHEPRYIWCHQNSKLDVWGTNAENGVLYWGAEDIDPQERDRFAKWFHLALTLSGRRRLLEKLPLNVFRIRWLAGMFPKAKFIHLIRHGRDTALSLEKAVAQWFPTDRYSEGYWESSRNYLMFEEYAENVPELSKKLDFVRQQADNYSRSLFVWLCSVWEGQRAGEEIGDKRYAQVRYEDLIRDPGVQLNRVFQFMEEPVDENVITYASTNLFADSVKKPDPNPNVTMTIAGDMLKELGYVCI